jgi:hypothetical protein
MTFAEKMSLVDAFENAYSRIEALVAGMSAAELAFVPPVEGAWSINDHLVHLLDADANLVYRVRGAVAESGITVPVWDQEAWQVKLKYSLSDGKKCLQTAKGLRAFIAESLRNLSDAEWEASGIVHPMRGAMSLADVVELYRGHADFHEKYILRNGEAFRAAQ